MSGPDFVMEKISKLKMLKELQKKITTERLILIVLQLKYHPISFMRLQIVLNDFTAMDGKQALHRQW